MSEGKNLCYKVLQETGYEGYLLKEAPERVLQFGEGNFLRAFTDVFIDRMNETAGFQGKVVVCQPKGNDRGKAFRGQDCLYTLLVRGCRDGKTLSQRRVISCLSRCLDPRKEFDEVLACAKNPDLRFIVSNTTEAGIVYDPSCRFEDEVPASFPAKLTRFLYARYQTGLPGFVILPCELIDNNGAVLKEYVLRHAKDWQLEEGFSCWVEDQNRFCSTLVDRIVPGYPKKEEESLWKEWGYRDELMDVCEPFASWVIEGDESLKKELPFEKSGLPISVVSDVAPYKKRKVRILNGVHTSMAPAAFLCGKELVRECMEDPVIREYTDRILEKEILPVLTDLDPEETGAFAKALWDRFSNPYLDHELLSICLNTWAKWKARVLPTVADHWNNEGKLSPLLVFSFAAFLSLYHCGGKREDGKEFSLRDDEKVLNLFEEQKDADDESLIEAILAADDNPAGELSGNEEFRRQVICDLRMIRELGMYEAVKRIVAI
ncbi:MAG: tagaturonate reductase [Lachnospiraceae bacterium]|nr:tagaturonate reductase [Lachnospiraceae bacterium]